METHLFATLLSLTLLPAARADNLGGAATFGVAIGSLVGCGLLEWGLAHLCVTVEQG